MEEFDGAQRAGDAIGSQIDQNHVGAESQRLADDGIGRGQRESRICADSAGNARAIDEDLEDGALVVVSGEDGYGQFGHNGGTLPRGEAWPVNSSIIAVT